MADIHKIIERIIKNSNLKESKHFQSTVYTDVPIIRTANQMDNFFPEKCRRMRQIASGFDYYNNSSKALFYEQAKFMENYEDDFVYTGEFFKYFPTYQSMTDIQLRGYFGWRTRLRKGEINKTCLSFAFVYIYELLNQIGVESDIDGYEKLCAFRKAYGDIDGRINTYIDLWTKDYIVYYGLEKCLYNKASDNSFDDKIIILSDYNSYTDDELFNALEFLSTYHFEHSKLFKQYSDDVKKTVCSVFKAVSEHYIKKCKKTYIEKLFGRRIDGPYTMFQSAVFYDRKKYDDYFYEVNTVNKFSCKNGIWRADRYYGKRNPSKELGVLLKTVDSMMRRKYNLIPLLKQEPETKLIASIIESALEHLEAEKKEAEKRKIVIDVSKLQAIRDTAAITRDKLIVEEDFEEEPDIITEPACQTKITTDLPLHENGVFLIRCLLNNEPYSEELRKKGIILSVLVDEINEALFDMFSDTVIVFDGENPELIEDYIDDLKGMI